MVRAGSILPILRLCVVLLHPSFGGNRTLPPFLILGLVPHLGSSPLFNWLVLGGILLEAADLGLETCAESP